MARISSLLASALVLLVAASATAKPAAQKAPRFKACKRDLPALKLNECLRDSLQKAVPELVKGIPEFGLETIDPLRVDLVEVPKGKGSVSVDIKLKDLDLVGFKNLKFKTFEYNIQKMKGKAKVEIGGNINLLGDYTVNGKVLVLPIVGSGRCNVTLVRPRGGITELVGKLEQKGGKQYVHVTSLKFVVDAVDRVHFRLENLFNGNKELSDNMNLVLNDNWEQIFVDLRGPVQEAMGEAFKDIANKVAANVPFDVLFPTKV